MATQVCYLLPGFLGSKLVYPGVRIIGDTTIWFRPWSLSSNTLTFLKMGDNPEDDHEDPIREAGILETVYGTLMRWLSHRFDRVVAVGYDFRRDVSSNAVALVARITADLQEGESATLIGHSMGGLIASACLIAGGHSLQQRFRNFITLGTPWGGSLRMVEALSGQGSSVTTARIASLGVDGARFFLSPHFIRSLLATFSGSYDLLPPKSLFDHWVTAGVPDHNNPDAWVNAGKPVNAARLAKSVIARELNRRVPSLVLHTAIVGTGHETPGPSQAEVLGQGSYGATLDGDDVVTIESATSYISTTTTRVDVQCSHTSLAWDQRAFDAIAAAIAE